MRRALAVAAAGAALAASVAACGSSGGSSAPAAAKAQTCWSAGAGIVIRVIETNPTLTSLPCSAPYALGQPVTTGPQTGLGTPTCDYSFTQIEWTVWDTDGGASGNAEAFCNQLSESG